MTRQLSAQRANFEKWESEAAIQAATILPSKLHDVLSEEAFNAAISLCSSGKPRLTNDGKLYVHANCHPMNKSFLEISVTEIAESGPQISTFVIDKFVGGICKIYFDGEKENFSVNLNFALLNLKAKALPVTNVSEETNATRSISKLVPVLQNASFMPRMRRAVRQETDLAAIIAPQGQSST